jgi:hypothetical protein
MHRHHWQQGRGGLDRRPLLPLWVFCQGCSDLSDLGGFLAVPVTPCQ